MVFQPRTEGFYLESPVHSCFRVPGSARPRQRFCTDSRMLHDPGSPVTTARQLGPHDSFCRAQVLHAAGRTWEGPGGRPALHNQDSEILVVVTKAGEVDASQAAFLRQSVGPRIALELRGHLKSAPISEQTFFPSTCKAGGLVPSGHQEKWPVHFAVSSPSSPNPLFTELCTKGPEGIIGALSSPYFSLPALTKGQVQSAQQHKAHPQPGKIRGTFRGERGAGTGATATEDTVCGPREDARRLRPGLWSQVSCRNPPTSRSLTFPSR